MLCFYIRLQRAPPKKPTTKSQPQSPSKASKPMPQEIRRMMEDKKAPATGSKALCTKTRPHQRWRWRSWWLFGWGGWNLCEKSGAIKRLYLCPPGGGKHTSLSLGSQAKEKDLQIITFRRRSLTSAQNTEKIHVSSIKGVKEITIWIRRVVSKK